MALKKALSNLTRFIFGFVVGLLIEFAAVFFYSLIDPPRTSNVKLFAVVLLQLLGLFYVMDTFAFVDDMYSRVGMLASQLFIFDYSLKRLYHPHKILGRL